MSRGKRKTPGAVMLGFESDFVTVPVEAVLPVRALGASVKSSRKYRQITASIREVGLVEPPVVMRPQGEEDTYMLLDGHVRIEVLKDLGIERVECLISTDDEAFTYNKRISRLAPIQEHKIMCKTNGCKHSGNRPDGIFWKMFLHGLGNFNAKGAREVRHFVGMRQACADAFNAL